MKKSFSIFLLFLAFCTREHKQTYDELRAAIEVQRQEFQREYQNADSAARSRIMIKARNYIFPKVIDEMFPHWFGTPWDFNGTTTVPRNGRIACGYFVTTVIQHSGFKVPRVKWAQMASEGMIKKITKDVKRFHNAPVSTVVAYLHGKSDGLYIVGLDSHVGFVYKRGGAIKFVHSNYYQSDVGVMAEELAGQNPLNDSAYRIFGRLFDDEMIRKWIMEEGWE